jgi:2-keto-4-pentenoate hydratase/2-oxohepta-3-ene-1,7-dioic acid hydratase in catechol pathway
LLTSDGVLDAGALLGGEATGVRELIAGGRLEELQRGFDGTDASPASGAELLPPLPDPEKIVCIGLNYRSHAAEAGIDPPEQPTFFAKFRNALAPTGATVELPAASEKVDYEAEIAFVIGRR